MGRKNVLVLYANVTISTEFVKKSMNLTTILVFLLINLI